MLSVHILFSNVHVGVKYLGVVDKIVFWASMNLFEAFRRFGWVNHLFEVLNKINSKHAPITLFCAIFREKVLNASIYVTLHAWVLKLLGKFFCYRLSYKTNR